MRLELRGRFTGAGLAPQHVATAQQWLGEASLAALQRFTRPLSELEQHRGYFSAEVTRLIGPVFFQHFRANGTVEILSVTVSAPPSISEQPATELEPWILELDPIVDAPTQTPVRPTAVVQLTSTPIEPMYLEQAVELARKSVWTVIAAHCAQGESVLDLLMMPSLLSDEINARFVHPLSVQAFARGTLRMLDLRLTAEDSATLRDLYAQIAAARGAQLP
jgi:hypothetical protein